MSSKLTQDTQENREFVTSFREGMVREILRHANKLVEDKKHDSRLAIQLCKLCFYRPEIGGRGLTEFECLRCKGKFNHGSTAVPVLCAPCASSSGQCTGCGADVDYK